MKFLLISLLTPLLMAFSATLYAETGYRVPSLLDEGERGIYMPQASYDILGVSIAEGSLEPIKAKLGDASLYEGLHGARNLCYLAGPHRVEFTVSNLGFGYEVTVVDEPWPECGTTSTPAVNGIGLKVGMGRAEVVSALGSPSETQDETLFYTYWVQEQLSQQDQVAFKAAHNLPGDESVWVDVYSTISVGLEDEKVVWFSINTTKTY